METDANYWALHKWLSKAWLEGIKSEQQGFRPVGMWALFGPEWREIEQREAQKITGEMIASDPVLKEHVRARIASYGGE